MACLTEADRLPARVSSGFFPPPAALHREAKKPPVAQPPLRSSRKRCGVDRAPADAEPSRPRWAWPEQTGDYDMATIGTFTVNSKGEFTGVIKTLTLNTKATLRPVEKDGEKSPDFRISAANMDIGAAWKKTSREGRDYISAKLDDPSFPAPIYATLSETDTPGEYALIWSR
tara:strand:+ start:1774 stop:2289 length:516 start_codon:yes stop_codon:yes gene_type:complete